MPLTNSQYDSIFRKYEEKQNRSRQRQLNRITEIYEKIPGYEEIDHSISSISVAQGKKLLNGDVTALDELHARLRELSDAKRFLLNKAGFPEDYLEPEHDCPLCQDTGYIDNEKCPCLKREIVSLLYAQSNIEEVLKRENFSALSYEYHSGEDLERFRATVSACQEFVRNFSGSYRNLFFYGTPGVGKTFLSNCVAKDLIEQGFLVLYFSANALIDTFSQNSFSVKNHENLYSPQEDIYNCDLLIIDDLGTEFTNAYVISRLFSCLNERHLRRKATLISTNLNLEELRNHYSERIFSRITSNYDIYKLTGPDIRLSQKKARNRK